MLSWLLEIGDPKTTLEQIPKDFGIHVGTLQKWLRQADVEPGWDRPRPDLPLLLRS